MAQPADVSARVEHHIGEGTTSEAAQAIDVTLQRVQTQSSGGQATAIGLPVDRLRAADAKVEPQSGSAIATFCVGCSDCVVISSVPLQAAKPQAINGSVAQRTARVALFIPNSSLTRI